MKELRERKGLKTVEVAYRLGVGESTVRGWEKGRGIPNALLVKPLLALYGVSLEELDQSIRQVANGEG